MQCGKDVNYDDLYDKLDVLNYEIKKMKKENLQLHEKNNKTVFLIIKNYKLLEEAVDINIENIGRLIKNQRKLLNMVSKS